MNYLAIEQILENNNSIFYASDVLDWQHYLAFKGYELKRVIGCGSESVVMLAKDSTN